MKDSSENILDRTARLLNEFWESKKGEDLTYIPIYELLPDLGCPWVIDKTHSRPAQVVLQDVIDGENDEVTASLMLLLSEIAIGEYTCSIAPASLLFGLWRNNGWRACLESEDSTYHLAFSVIDYLETFTDNPGLDLYVAGAVVKLLNTWLQPSTAWTDMPAASEVTRQLFGDAWCTFALPNYDWAISTTMIEQRPPFLPGLCPAQDASLLCLQLPGLSL